MTSIETHILLLLFLSGIGLLLWRLSKFTLAAIKQREIDATEKLGILLESAESDIDQYSFFTAGHPYVWSETSIEEIHENFKRAARTQRCDPSRFQIRICETRKAIYFLDESVMRYRSFDWDKLMHYEEWLESNKAVKENIAKYKNKSLQSDQGKGMN